MTIIIARYLCTLGINIYSIVSTYAIILILSAMRIYFRFISDELNGFITDILVVHSLLFHS